MTVMRVRASFICELTTNDFYLIALFRVAVFSIYALLLSSAKRSYRSLQFSAKRFILLLLNKIFPLQSCWLRSSDHGHRSGRRREKSVEKSGKFEIGRHRLTGGRGFEEWGDVMKICGLMMFKILRKWGGLRTGLFS